MAGAVSAPRDHSHALSLRDVRFGYTRRTRPWGATPPVALRCDRLDVPDGLTLLLGPNGAGKSTLLKLVAGVEAPEAGTVLVRGRDLWRDEVDARRGIAYVPEQPDLTPYATVREVVRLVAALRGASLAEGDEALAQAGLADLAWRTVRELSMGQRRRAVLAAALVGRPDVLLLDEPLEAMDRAMRERIVAWVAERVRDGAAAIVATHEIAPFVPLAARAIAVHDGVPRVIDPLPDEPARGLVLDALARGDDAAAR
jgi:ABC-2 type transport system ATP-binding protein